MRAPKYILSLAALDTSGGAGLNQDTRVAYLHGCHLLTCCTALTLQTSHGVEAIYPTSAQQLQTMLLRMLSQYDVSAVKIGALVNAEQIDLVHNTFSHARSYPVVLDPVLAPTEGAVFIAPNLREMYRRMLHSIDYVIPNLPELSILSDLHVEGRDSILNAAKTITETYSTNVFVSGGHGRDNLDKRAARLALYTWNRMRFINGIYLFTGEWYGCSHSCETKLPLGFGILSEMEYCG